MRPYLKISLGLLTGKYGTEKEDEQIARSIHLAGMFDGVIISVPSYHEEPHPWGNQYVARTFQTLHAIGMRKIIIARKLWETWSIDGRPFVSNERSHYDPVWYINAIEEARNLANSISSMLLGRTIHSALFAEPHGDSPQVTAFKKGGWGMVNKSLLADTINRATRDVGLVDYVTPCAADLPTYEGYMSKLGINTSDQQSYRQLGPNFEIPASQMPPDHIHRSTLACLMVSPTGQQGGKPTPTIEQASQFNESSLAHIQTEHPETQGVCWYVQNHEVEQVLNDMQHPSR